MMLNSFVVLLLQCLYVRAQVYYSQPSANQVISGGVPFSVTCGESHSAPYFSQMSNYSLILFAGSYSSPQVLYAWDLDNTSPATVSNSITIPQSIGPSAISAYFLGISGWLLLNSSISVTSFSPKFTLQNMTGPSSAISSVASTPAATSTITFASTTVVRVETTPAGRLIICTDADGDVTEGETGGNGGVVNTACELEALAVLSVLATASRTIAVQTQSTPATTSPPVLSNYAGNLATTSDSSPSSTSAGTASTVASSNGIASLGASSGQSAKMVEMLIIAGITLATVIILFWIWRCYRGAENYCDHLECDHYKMRRICDAMMRKIPGIMKPKHESDAEKGDVVPNSPIDQRVMESEREAEAAAARRRRFEEQMKRRESRRKSSKTILAELEGDLGISAEPVTPLTHLMPPMPVETERRDQVPELAIKRKTMVGQGQQGMVVKGRDAAVIVAVKKGGSGSLHSTSSSRVISERDLPPIPVHRTSDDDDEAPVPAVLQILYVKGENDEDDGVEPCLCQVRTDDEAVSPIEEKSNVDLDLKKEEDKRIREKRKEKLRHKRGQFSIQRRELGSARKDSVSPATTEAESKVDSCL